MRLRECTYSEESGLLIRRRRISHKVEWGSMRPIVTVRIHTYIYNTHVEVLIQLI